MCRKKCHNHGLEIKRAILIGSRPGEYSRLMLNKTKGKASWEKKKGNRFCERKFFQKRNHETTELVLSLFKNDVVRSCGILC